jgi:hypothetical protein
MLPLDDAVTEKPFIFLLPARLGSTSTSVFHTGLETASRAEQAGMVKISVADRVRPNLVNVQSLTLPRENLGRRRLLTAPARMRTLRRNWGTEKIRRRSVEGCRQPSRK